MCCSVKPHENYGMIKLVDAVAYDAAIEHYKRQRNENAAIAEGLAERIHHECHDYSGYLAAMEEIDTEDYELP